MIRTPINPTEPDTIFSDEERVESQLKRAIEYFHQEYGCRIFNLSIGHRYRVYMGGRQLPWAELLDTLARELDIVITVAAGNVSDPDIPIAHHSNQFQKEVAKALKDPEHRLIDPATAALCLTVGSIARREDPYYDIYGYGLSSGTKLAASAEGCPSPFTRCGPGPAGAIKPEVVAPGGNYALHTAVGRPRWNKTDPNLAEPTLNRAFASEGRFLRSVSGTSYAAAHVAHIAARMETSLREQLNTPPSQNLVRALLVNSTSINSNVRSFIGTKQSDLLNAMGYGQPSVEYCWSLPNRATLVTEDVVEYRNFHVYSLIVPEDFLHSRGDRSISVSLAYDPPTRLSRRDYIATAMWIEIFGGLTTEQVIEYRSKYSGDRTPPTVPKRNRLNFKPGGQTIRMSTVQKRAWHSNRGTMFLNRPDPNGDASLHIFVGCQPRFPNPLGEDRQRYALVVTLQHDNQLVDIYQDIRATVSTRTQIRV